MLDSKNQFLSLYVGIIFSFVLINSSYAQYSDTIRLNDIRILASHNSYKKKPDPKVLSFLNHFKKRLGDDLDPKRLDYGHLPLSEQFDDYGIRGIELDVYYDPKGGKFSKRKLNFLICGLKQKVKDSVMHQPGFKMLHIADIDYETNYLTFKSALEEIYQWSSNNPQHIPLYITIEPKGESAGDYSGFLRLLGFKKAIKYDSIAYRALDNEILDVFKNTSILFTPKDLMAGHKSISERLKTTNWPTLNSCLGKVIFIVDGDQNDMYQTSLENGEERPMFTFSEPGKLTAAFIKRNNPIGQEEVINNLTNDYIVRTRSDVETMQARSDDYSMFNAAMNSNAQIISTDYYREDPIIGSFKISLDSFKIFSNLPFILRM